MSAAKTTTTNTTTTKRKRRRSETVLFHLTATNSSMSRLVSRGDHMDWQCKIYIQIGSINVNAITTIYSTNALYWMQSTNFARMSIWLAATAAALVISLPMHFCQLAAFINFAIYAWVFCICVRDFSIIRKIETFFWWSNRAHRKHFAISNICRKRMQFVHRTGNVNQLLILCWWFCAAQHPDPNKLVPTNAPKIHVYCKPWEIRPLAIKSH